MIKKYFIAGLLIWLPILVTIFVLKFILGFLDSIVLALPDDYQPSALFNIHIPGFGIVISLIVILLTGVLITNIFGHKLLEWAEHLLQKVPVVGTLYSGTKQVLETVVSSQGQSFRKAVLIQYPSPGIWSIGFLAGSAHQEVTARCAKPMMSVFIPTTPNPTSGFLVMVPQEGLIELNIPVEEALKFVISLGTLSGAIKPAVGDPI
jgi:uncharacterized membrane protein